MLFVKHVRCSLNQVKEEHHSFNQKKRSQGSTKTDSPQRRPSSKVLSKRVSWSSSSFLKNSNRRRRKKLRKRLRIRSWKMSKWRKKMRRDKRKWWMILNKRRNRWWKRREFRWWKRRERPRRNKRKLYLSLRKFRKRKTMSLLMLHQFLRKLNRHKTKTC